MQKVPKKLPDRRQYLILLGSIAVTLIAVVLIPHGGTSSNEMTELERRDAMSQAADSYLLANTQEERQSAYWEVHKYHNGERSVSTSDTSGLLAILRIALMITILGLSGSCISLCVWHMKTLKAMKARQT